MAVATALLLVSASLVVPTAKVWLGQEFRDRRLPRTLGAVAEITEVSSGVSFVARVDTGAAVSSLHCPSDALRIEDASDDPTENLNKTAHIRVENRNGKACWIATEIEDYVEVTSANGAEHRYQVRLPLRCGPVQKRAIVTLKDRSRMSFRLLLGRDFLAGNFVVDVSKSRPQSL